MLSVSELVVVVVIRVCLQFYSRLLIELSAAFISLAHSLNFLVSKPKRGSVLPNRSIATSSYKLCDCAA